MERRLREAQEQLEEARDERDATIEEAWRKGGGMREIAEVVGMSHVGVSKLLERRGVRKPWDSVAAANREYEEQQRRYRENP